MKERLATGEKLGLVLCACERGGDGLIYLPLSLLPDFFTL